MFSTSPASGLRITVAVILALLIGVAVPVAIVLAVHGDHADDASVPDAPVMAGHGTVMPTDVRVSGGVRLLAVGVGDYWFKPSSRRLAAGRYTLSARNYGILPHDVMIERTPIEFSAPGQPVDEAAPYGVEELEPGAAKSSGEVVLGPGRWVLFCSLPGHYTAGQRAVIDVYGQLPKGMEESRGGMSEEDDDADAGEMSPATMGG